MNLKTRLTSPLYDFPSSSKNLFEVVLLHRGYIQANINLFFRGFMLQLLLRIKDKLFLDNPNLISFPGPMLVSNSN